MTLHPQVPRKVLQMLTHFPKDAILHLPPATPAQDVALLIRHHLTHLQVITPDPHEHTLTPYAYGLSLLRTSQQVTVEQHDLHLLKLIQGSDHHPATPEDILQHWKTHHSTEKRSLHALYAQLDRETEYRYSVSGRSDLTGLLHLPVMLGLKQPRPLLTLLPSPQDLITGRHHLLYSRTSSQVIYLAENSGSAPWKLTPLRTAPP